MTKKKSKIAAVPDAPEVPPQNPLNACPCGQVPTNLMIEMPERGKYGRTMGDCCGKWEIEFRNGFTGEPAITNLRAIEAWNTAPRAAA